MTALLRTVTVTCQQMKRHNMRAVILRILRSVLVSCCHLQTIGRSRSPTWTGYVALKFTFFQLHYNLFMLVCHLAMLVLSTAISASQKIEAKLQ